MNLFTYNFCSLTSRILVEDYCSIATGERNAELSRTLALLSQEEYCEELLYHPLFFLFSFILENREYKID